MRRHIFSIALFLMIPSLAGASLAELFQKAKTQFRLGAYQQTLETLDLLEAQGASAELPTRRVLLPALAFYRGASLAALGKSAQARAEFETFLAFQPTATLDPALYSKAVVRELESARRQIQRPSRNAETSGSLMSSYRGFIRVTDSAESVDERWADGPVRFLLTKEERLEFSRIPDPVSLGEFVTRFWESRDQRPQTPENEFQREIEKRILFADFMFTQGETRGSLTDRGMVFLLLGPPSYAGRKPLRTGDDAHDAAGLSRYSRFDVLAAKGGGSTGAQAARLGRFTSPTLQISDANASWREIWHYRRELLPEGVPFQQVDFDFITRKGYGENVLQRDDEALKTLEFARRKLSKGEGALP